MYGDKDVAGNGGGPKLGMATTGYCDIPLHQTTWKIVFILSDIECKYKALIIRTICSHMLTKNYKKLLEI